MATLSRLKIWIAGDLLTATDLNNEFNNIVNDYNGNIDTNNIKLSISPAWSGVHTFSNSAIFNTGVAKIGGAGVGRAALAYANSATNRTLTIPDPGADSIFAVLAGAQTFTGAKTFANTTLLVAGAGAGIATLINANTANSRIITIPDPGVNSTLVTLAGTQTITGNLTLNGTNTVGGATTFNSGNLLLAGPGVGVATLRNSNTATNRILELPDPGTSSTLMALDGAQTILGAKTFSGANTLIIPTAAPSSGNSSIAFVNSEIEIFNGAAVQHFPPTEFWGQGLTNIAFAQGADSSILKITSAANAALSSSNPGYVRIRSSTNGSYRTYRVTADVTIDLTGSHWALDAHGDVTGAILRVYAIDDNGTLRWGIGYCGGFYYIRNTQDGTSTVALAENILTDTGVGTDNSPMRDVGWIKGNFTDATNEWALTEYHPNETADGISQPWDITYLSGFSANPTATVVKWFQIGKMVTVVFTTNANGTSNATNYTVTLPVKAQDIVRGPALKTTDNGVALTTVGLVTTTASSTTLTVTKDGTAAAWTNANAKGADWNFTYEAFQP